MLCTIRWFSLAWSETTAVPFYASISWLTANESEWRVFWYEALLEPFLMMYHTPLLCDLLPGQSGHIREVVIHERDERCQPTSTIYIETMGLVISGHLHHSNIPLTMKDWLLELILSASLVKWWINRPKTVESSTFCHQYHSILNRETQPLLSQLCIQHHFLLARCLPGAVCCLLELANQQLCLHCAGDGSVLHWDTPHSTYFNVIGDQ